MRRLNGRSCSSRCPGRLSAGSSATAAACAKGHAASRTPRPAARRSPLCAQISSRAKRRTIFAVAATSPATEEENAANKRRWVESGNQQGSSDQWRWTLNYNQIIPNILIGSCPRTAQDVEIIAQQTGATAILNLQCDDCFRALGIDIEEISAATVSHGIVLTRVPLRDFDQNDQAVMLSEAAKMLGVLLSLGHNVYVHCTAGINRASLTVLGYLTFVKGQNVHQTLNFIKEKRPMANPYLLSWMAAKKIILSTSDPSEVQVKAEAKRLYEASTKAGGASDASADWDTAQTRIIERHMNKLIAATAGMAGATLAQQKGAHQAQLREFQDSLLGARDQLASMSQTMMEEHEKMVKALTELEVARALLRIAVKGCSPEQAKARNMEEVNKFCTTAPRLLSGEMSHEEQLKFSSESQATRS